MQYNHICIYIYAIETFIVSTLNILQSGHFIRAKVSHLLPLPGINVWTDSFRILSTEFQTFKRWMSLWHSCRVWSLLFRQQDSRQRTSEGTQHPDSAVSKLYLPDLQRILRVCILPHTSGQWTSQGGREGLRNMQYASENNGASVESVGYLGDAQWVLNQSISL